MRDSAGTAVRVSYIPFYRGIGVLPENLYLYDSTMMKKFFFFILAFLYIASSCEASVYLHYCMGRPVSFSFSPGKSGTCHHCGMKKSDKGMGCCKDEQKIIKSDKSQKVTDLVTSDIQQKKFLAVLTAYDAFSVYTCHPSAVISYPSHGPPPREAAVSICLMNCLFLI
jgi:hypothetical protein